MKITFEEMRQNKEWLIKELKSSLPTEIYEKAAGDGFVDVKLLVNGVELEPEFYNNLVNNIEEFVDFTAKDLVLEKLTEAENKAIRLLNIVEAAKDDIIREFNLGE